MQSRYLLDGIWGGWHHYCLSTSVLGGPPFSDPLKPFALICSRWLWSSHKVRNRDTHNHPAHLLVYHDQNNLFTSNCKRQLRWLLPARRILPGTWIWPLVGKDINISLGRRDMKDILGITGIVSEFRFFSLYFQQCSGLLLVCKEYIVQLPLQNAAKRIKSFPWKLQL